MKGLTIGIRDTAKIRQSQAGEHAKKQCLAGTCALCPPQTSFILWPFERPTLRAFAHADYLYRNRTIVQVAAERRRDGAYQWGVFEDTAKCMTLA